MKLVCLTALILLTKIAKGQNFQHEQYPFPPQFQGPNSGVFSTENSLYLPPESHTALPYFPIKSANNLQYQYLPPTGTKAPPIYPSPFPLMMSSTFIPSFDEDEDEEDGNNPSIQIPSQPPRIISNNQSQDSPRVERRDIPERKEMRSLPVTVQYRHPIDRADTKIQSQLGSIFNQAPVSRRMIISPPDQSDQIHDQEKTASYQNSKYISPPGNFLGSTTEIAIPILRLSNEMDLDGSYSYEALGADQTHYVQHSHMENAGTDNEEHVVEGSYSYIGDNGQTYTVHYIADGNGFRATGDHLPVAPAIPEIIQRAVQYNLAEEAKRPAHLKSWQEDYPDRENTYREKSQHFEIPPTRSLFTGKAPEAFTRNYGQATSMQDNNLIASASTQAPVKTIDYTNDQTQSKQHSPSPQVTFLASQGAHVPQKSISRMFLPKPDTSEIPQMINYENNVKDNDHDRNKGLWRWQYGINSDNQGQTKNFISRSSGDNDDVLINFNDMTQQQYTQMIQSQVDLNSEEDIKIFTPPFSQSTSGTILQKNVHFTDSQLPLKAQSTEMKPVTMEPKSPTVNIPDPNYWYSKKTKPFTPPNVNKIVDHQPHFEKPVSEQHAFTETKLSANAYQKTSYPQSSDTDTTQRNRLELNHSEHLPKSDIYGEKQVQNIQNPFSSEHVTKLKPEYQEHSTPNARLPLENEWYDFKKDSELIINYDVNANIKPNNVESRGLVAENRPFIITQNHFIPPSKTVTQSYDYEDSSYEPRKLRSYQNTNYDSEIHHDPSIHQYEIAPNQHATEPNHIHKQPEIQQKDSQEQQYQQEDKLQDKIQQTSVRQQKQSSPMSHDNMFTSQPSESNDWYDEDDETFEKRISTQETPISTTASNYKFSDFLVHETKNDQFRPIESTKFQISLDILTTTTEASVEDILQNNFFLKNLFRQEKKPVKSQNTITEEPKEQKDQIVNLETREDKTAKYINLKPFDDVKTFKNKPLDMSAVLNFVASKNHFESGRTKPKGKSTYNDHIKPKFERNVHVIEDNSNKVQQIEEDVRQRLNKEKQEEQKAFFKNYKVLNRNSNINADQKNRISLEMQPPALKSYHLQTSDLPPLGRAGPTLKSYLPPIYVKL